MMKVECIEYESVPRIDDAEQKQDNPKGTEFSGVDQLLIGARSIFH